MEKIRIKLNDDYIIYENEIKELTFEDANRIYNEVINNLEFTLEYDNGKTYIIKKEKINVRYK